MKLVFGGCRACSDLGLIAVRSWFSQWLRVTKICSDALVLSSWSLGALGSPLNPKPLKP